MKPYLIKFLLPASGVAFSPEISVEGIVVANSPEDAIDQMAHKVYKNKDEVDFAKSKYSARELTDEILKEQLEKAFNAGRDKMGPPDWDNVYESFEEYYSENYKEWSSDQLIENGGL